MATIANGILKYVANTYGAATQVLEGVKEANSQAFKKGDLVCYDGAGALRALAATAFVNDGTDDSLDISDHVSVSAATTEPKIVGIALRDASNVTSGNLVIPVQMLRAGDVVEGNLMVGIDGGALTDSTAALNMLGDPVSLIQRDTAATNYVFSTTTAEEFGRILRLNLSGGRGAVGDLNWRVHVIVRGDIWFLS